MVRRQSTAEEAFDILVVASQRAGRKLRDITTGIVEGRPRRRSEARGAAVPRTFRAYPGESRGTLRKRAVRPPFPV
jgi:hypothetical protein